MLVFFTSFKWLPFSILRQVSPHGHKMDSVLQSLSQPLQQNPETDQTELAPESGRDLSDWRLIPALVILCGYKIHRGVAAPFPNET